MGGNTNTQQEIDNCTIMKDIKNTNMTCSGVGEEKCAECPKAEPALADMHKAGSEVVPEHTEKETAEENAEMVPMGTASLKDIVTGNVPAPTDEEVAEAIAENNKPLQVRAKEKLEEELKKAKDKSFAEPIIEHLLKRCAEDAGLAEDVCQKHKTWDKCFDFIYESARKSAKGSRQCAVRNDVVFEWAEDYYHKDDKAEEEKKAKEKAEAAKKAKEKAEQKGKAEKSKPNKSFEDSATKKFKAEAKAKAKETEQKATTAEKPKKNNRDMEGQLDLFSMMGL